MGQTGPISATSEPDLRGFLDDMAELATIVRTDETASGWRSNLEAVATWWHSTDEWTVAFLFGFTLFLLALAGPFLWPGLLWCLDRAAEGVRAISAAWRAQVARIKGEAREATEEAEEDASSAPPSFFTRLMALEDEKASTWLLRGFSAIAILVGLAVGIRLVPLLTYEAPTTNEHGELLAFRVGLAALVALIGMPLLFIRSWINERQTRVAEKQSLLAEQGHVTDRIIKATELLGQIREEKRADGTTVTVPNIEVRLGAIYTLERVARESLDDHLTIMETFAAYVRQNHASKLKINPHSKTIDGLNVEQLPQVENLNEDVYSAISVVARRGYAQRVMEVDTRRNFEWGKLDLPCVNLEGVFAQNKEGVFQEDLTKAFWPGVRLRGAFLENAKAWLARLQGAEFWQAKLADAQFLGANLQEADFWRADLRAVDFRNADLTGASFTDAIVDGACLIGVSLVAFEGDGCQKEARFRSKKSAKILQTQINRCFCDEALFEQLEAMGLELPVHHFRGVFGERENHLFEWKKWLAERRAEGLFDDDDSDDDASS